MNNYVKLTNIILKKYFFTMKYDEWWYIAKFSAAQRDINALQSLFQAVSHLGRSYLSKDKFLAELYAVAAANIQSGDIWYFHIDAFDKWQQLDPLLNILPVKQIVTSVEQSRINFHESSGFYTPKGVSEITTVYDNARYKNISTHFVYEDGKFDFYVRRNRNYCSYGVKRIYYDGKTLFERDKGSGYCNETIFVNQFARYKCRSGRVSCQETFIDDDSEPLDLQNYVDRTKFYSGDQREQYRFKVHLDTTESRMFKDGFCFDKRCNDKSYTMAQKLLPDFYLDKEKYEKYFEHKKTEFFDKF